MKAINLQGRTFGRLRVVRFDGSRVLGDGKSYRYWECLCECGNICFVSTGNLLHGKDRIGPTKSCGCLQKEKASEGQLLHGLTGSPEYVVWAHMRQRCLNPKTKDAGNYHERGITVCERWSDFKNFLSDMGPRPSSGHSIERVNNDLGYSPDNCKWAERREQNENKRNNRWLTFNGRTLTVSQWARELGIKPTILHHRTHRGWPVERVLGQEVRTW